MDANVLDCLHAYDDDAHVKTPAGTYVFSRFMPIPFFSSLFCFFCFVLQKLYNFFIILIQVIYYLFSIAQIAAKEFYFGRTLTSLCISLLHYVIPSLRNVPGTCRRIVLSLRAIFGALFQKLLIFTFNTNENSFKTRMGTANPCMRQSTKRPFSF